MSNHEIEITGSRVVEQITEDATRAEVEMLPSQSAAEQGPPGPPGPSGPQGEQGERGPQ
jgi:hypothetical protein